MNFEHQTSANVSGGTGCLTTNASEHTVNALFDFQRQIKKQQTKYIFSSAFFLKQRIKFREPWSPDSDPAAVIMWSKSRPKAWRYSGSSPDLQSPRWDPFWKPTAAPTAPSVCGEEQRGRRNMFKDLCTTGAFSFKSLPLLSAFLWKCLDKGMKITAACESV